MLDASLIFDGTVSSAGAVAGVAITTTAVSTNVIDLLSARDEGAGDEIEIHVRVLETFVGGTSLQVKLQSCATSGGSYVDLMLSPVYLTANLTAGTGIFAYKLPVTQLNDTGTPNQYLQLDYVVVGTYSAGKVFSYLTGGGDRQVFRAYPSGFSVASGS